MSTTIETLLQSLPSREDLAHAIGYETRHSSALDIVPALSLFGTGMLFDLSQTMQQYGYGEGEDTRTRQPGDRQMASQTGTDSSRYGSQQDYPRQMSGQTSMEQNRQMSSQPTHTPGQSSTSRQMSGHQSEQRSESELTRTRTPGTGTSRS
jgi:hypothetical protein